MAIRKHEFYEGAAIHQLVRTGGVQSLRYESPCFIVNERLWVYLKYSTKGRSPWSFTFTVDEQGLLEDHSNHHPLVLGLICGSDGIAALGYGPYSVVASRRTTAVRVACFRRHGEHYAVSGPDGELPGKIAPGLWQQIAKGGGTHESL
jgi:hypothetical protein